MTATDEVGKGQRGWQWLAYKGMDARLFACRRKKKGKRRKEKEKEKEKKKEK